MSSIDEKIRIDHGNDFTLVDKIEFYKNIKHLFFLAHFTKDYGHKYIFENNVGLEENLNRILSYQGKSEEEWKELYKEFYLSNSPSNPITFAAEAILKNSAKKYKKARGNSNYSN
ncbi:MAG TPA: hypothetical protein VEC16_02915 [Alphaproteobacteria bacterium]|nr:hypothetical protein [Alphaproteobacteria bacterium]